MPKSLKVKVVDRKTKKKDTGATIDVNVNNRIVDRFAEGKRELSKRPLFNSKGDGEGEQIRSSDRNKKAKNKSNPKSDSWDSVDNAAPYVAFGKDKVEEARRKGRHKPKKGAIR